jgi:D-amino-acid oxidase
MARVVVVGAGVIGLTCAVRLFESGHEAAVVARDLPLETTSAVAPALWHPRVPGPADDPDRVRRWAAASYTELEKLTSDDATGVVMRTGTELFRERTKPWFADVVDGLEPVDRVPHGYVDGWVFRAPVVEMPLYLRWLAGRVEDLGGTITRMALSGLPDTAEVVVNAAGLGGRLLGHDPSVEPVRGQVVYVEQVGLDHWWLDGGGPSYAIPRSRDIVLGGTDDAGAWDRAPDRSTTQAIVERAAALVPELRWARVRGTRVGLRPSRPSVRLEAERSAAGAFVVHCYGHGGTGVTLSWGCADDVAELVSRI